jgi:hypothetical protein
MSTGEKLKETISMRNYLLAAATAALFALPLPASAAAVTAPGVMSDVSAQTVVVRPGGVRVHGRFESRERRGHRHGRRCTTETTTTMRRGREVTVRRKVCR